MRISYQKETKGRSRKFQIHTDGQGDQMKKTPLILTFLLILLLALAGTAFAHPQNFKAHMSASSGVDSSGQGQAKFQLDHNELDFIMPVSRLNDDTTAAHIHISETPGGNGGIFVSLCGAFGPPPIPVADCGGPGHPAKGSVTLNDEQIDTLKAAIAENRAYVNVHTTAVPSGEIRGQITANP
jgi:hypothetical protein